MLRAFEQEIGHDVIRPISLAGVMGAYGAALYAKQNQRAEWSSLLTAGGPGQLHPRRSRAVTCNGCTNHCRLTINTFAGGETLHRRQPLRAKPGLNRGRAAVRYNLYDYKRELLDAYGSAPGKRETIGLPMGLNFFELLPFWHTFLTHLGFERRASRPSPTAAALPPGPGHHPLGHGLLPGQAHARPRAGPASTRAWTPSSTPA